MPARTPLLAALAAVLTSGPALAQKPKVKIEEAKVGLPAGRYTAARDANQRGASVVKRNVWAPIYLRLEMLGEYDGNAQLRIDAADADDLRTALTVPLTTTFAGRLPGSKVEPTEFGSLPYVRVGDRAGEITLTVQTAPTDGSRPRDLSEPLRFGTGGRYLQFRDVSTYVVLSLGSRMLPGFELPETQKGSGGTRGPLRDGRVETAGIDNVRDMPDQWFGYNAADLVVLTTGSDPNNFLAELFDDQLSAPFKERREALLEWVRRGGRLVVSVGANAARLSQYERFREILPAGLNRDRPSRGVNELVLKWRIAGGSQSSENLRPRTDTFPVAQLVPNPARPARVLIPETDAETADQPVVVQAPYGLGRVTVVAFDLEQSPFADANRRPEFWDWLIREAGSAQAALESKRANQNVFTYGAYGSQDTEDEYAAAIRTHIDTFEGVPVVSFGWVALFIVLYTLLIGPVEYLILKKVFGRLELTWITFPLIVVTVSAAAYFTAYTIKGGDLKLNKVDVIDVDVQGGRVYGRTWFTVFSPRIDSYTIGVEPNDGWSVTPANAPAPPTLVGWMAGGRGTGGGGIVSRGYTYHTDRSGRVIADGLDRVPIQVWSTKAFTASWSGYIDKGTPLIDADLYHPPGDPRGLDGTFVNNLPLRALQDPVLVYAGKVYKLPALTPGQKVRVSTTLPEDNQWLASNVTTVGVTAANYQPYPNYPQAKVQAPTTSNLSLWGALFHEQAAGTGGLMNASLRELDQSWRLGKENRSEAILLARVTQPVEPTEELMRGPNAASPTKLWLKGHPGDAAREPIPGTMRQETYVRVYIPVQQKPKGAGK